MSKAKQTESENIKKYKNYDLSWIVKLAEEQHPKMEWFAEACRNCRECYIQGYSIMVAPKPNKLKPDKESGYYYVMLDAGEGIGLLACHIDNHEYYIKEIEFFTAFMEALYYDYRDWIYTKATRKMKEWKEELEFRKTGRDEFYGVAIKSGGARSKRKAPKY